MDLNKPHDPAAIIVSSLALLLKSLSHKIRSPLAVISNELTALQSDGSDCSLALRKVTEISELLKELCLIGVSGEGRTAPIGFFLRAFAGQPSEIRVAFDPVHLELVAKWSSEVLKQAGFEPIKARSTVVETGLDVTVEVSDRPANSAKRGGGISSFCTFLSENERGEHYAAPLLDILYQAYRVKVDLEFDGGIMLRLAFPKPP